MPSTGSIRNSGTRSAEERRRVDRHEVAAHVLLVLPARHLRRRPPEEAALQASPPAAVVQAALHQDRPAVGSSAPLGVPARSPQKAEVETAQRRLFPREALADVVDGSLVITVAEGDRAAVQPLT